MSKLLGYENNVKKQEILNVQINLLNKCTSRCKSCRKYLWPNEELGFDDVCKTLKVLKQNFNLQTVLFSGGDPLLYNNFEKVIDFCVDNGIVFSVITTLITKDKKLLKKIAEKAYRIHVSIDAQEPRLYKNIRGVDAFEIVNENVNFVNKIRANFGLIPIRISATIGAINFQQPIQLYQYAKKTGCLINFYLLHTWDSLKMSSEQIESFYTQMRIIARDEKECQNVISNSRDMILSEYDVVYTDILKKDIKCYIPSIYAAINVNGDIYPCCKLFNENGDYGEQVKYSYGNICNKSEDEVVQEFEKRFLIEYPIKNSDCKDCFRHYVNVIDDLSTIKNGKKVPIFI